MILNYNLVLHIHTRVYVYYMTMFVYSYINVYFENNKECNKNTIHKITLYKYLYRPVLTVGLLNVAKKLNVLKIKLPSEDKSQANVL